METVHFELTLDPTLRFGQCRLIFIHCRGLLRFRRNTHINAIVILCSFGKFQSLGFRY